MRAGAAFAAIWLQRYLEQTPAMLAEVAFAVGCRPRSEARATCTRWQRFERLADSLKWIG